MLCKMASNHFISVIFLFRIPGETTDSVGRRVFTDTTFMEELFNPGLLFLPPPVRPLELKATPAEADVHALHCKPVEAFRGRDPFRATTRDGHVTEVEYVFL